MKMTKAQLRAMRTPKGANPFSAPQLFAKPPRSRTRRANPPNTSSVVVAPVATTRIERGAGPTGVDTITVRRREYIGDINGSSTFAVTSYADNPGLPGTYPWLSDIATNYEQYEVLSRSFCFETEAPTSATGAVILSYDYDTLDSAPVDKTAALLVKDSVRTAPWQSSRLVLKAADLKRRGKLYTRPGSVSSSDLKTYDLGKLSVSTQGQAGTTVVGELWFEYVIKLHIAQQRSSPGVTVSSGGTVSKTAIFGTAATYVGNTPVTGSASTLTFNQPGYFLLTMSVTGTALQNGNYAVTSSTGSSCSILTGTNITNGAFTTQNISYAIRALANATFLWDVSAATTVTATTTWIGEFIST